MRDIRSDDTRTDDRDWELTVDHVARPDEGTPLLAVDFEGSGDDRYLVVDPALSGHANHDSARATDDAPAASRVTVVTTTGDLPT
ncbi:hypothetical protein [Haloarcula montana]|uniref:hypothetical protein n=1 Tax=Haloarcula montana TaxID=3111776 RepID=UPI002D7774BD|nr:hypothetical protein [Haloarcula sp. GH36]